MLSTSVGSHSSESPETSRQGMPGNEPHKVNPIPEFPITVDSEHKATVFWPLSVAQPHMRAFHLTWISFFTCFFSTFAAAPLLPVIRNNLDLTAIDMANAGIASVSGSVFSRLCAGPFCDLAGPRYTFASLLLLTAPAVFAMATVSSATRFILTRFFIGFSLATFVSSQFWMGSMFASNILGLANGAATGLGNVGAAATQLMMPLLYLLIHSSFHSTPFTAWRIAFFVPGLMQVTMGLVVLCLGQDLPDGDYKRVTSGDELRTVAWYALTNYRSWVLAVTYGYCFGVELTVNNIIALYFYDWFDLDVEIAGVIASSFGLANFFTCPCGGILSDVTARRLGMRGRLWVLWALQTTAGVFCILLARASGSLALSVLFLLLFSVFVQASCGATYGIIPFISRRSLGAIAGMVGAGGIHCHTVLLLY
ncbi:hypothetical protein SUGI_0041130 [Cryptomeria japonica]|nr:hypothetical protein SUGI_0041130 [Cryptomeria japonica]